MKNIPCQKGYCDGYCSADDCPIWKVRLSILIEEVGDIEPAIDDDTLFEEDDWALEEGLIADI